MKSKSVEDSKLICILDSLIGNTSPDEEEKSSLCISIPIKISEEFEDDSSGISNRTLLQIAQFVVENSICFLKQSIQ